MAPSAARRRANGSFEPVGFSPIAKKPTRRVELVGERDGDADRGARAAGRSGPAERSARRSRRDLGLLAVMQRVMPAHDALQLRELADHAGDQIGLAQQPCPGRELGRRPRARAARASPPASRGAPPWRRASRGAHGTRRHRAPGPGWRAAACGPCPRRTGRPTGARAARARCLRRSPGRRPWPGDWRPATKRGARRPSASSSARYF